MAIRKAKAAMGKKAPAKKKAPARKQAETRTKPMARKQTASRKACTPQSNREVDAWFARLDSPQKETMLAARAALLAADARISECIKWSCPTFVFEGNLTSIQPNAKRHTSLMFHRGAEIPGKHPGLEGTAKFVRTMKFDSPADVRARRGELKAIVKAWCDSR